MNGSGCAVIFADMWAAVVDDMPPAVLLLASAPTALAVVVVLPRRPRLLSCWRRWAWRWSGWWRLRGRNVRLNFLNFIALPITFGIGVDYAVNIVRALRAGGRPAARWPRSGRRAAPVILCSLTTTLGYLALLRPTTRR